MEDKIIDEIKTESSKRATKYLKLVGVIDNEEDLKYFTDKKNIDLMRILCKLELIEENETNLKKIEEFYESLFKYGLNMGISNGKLRIIEAIKNNDIDFKKLMEINPRDYLTPNFEPTILDDIREAILNEK